MSAEVQNALHKLAVERVTTPALAMAAIFLPLLVIYGLARWKPADAAAPRAVLRTAISLFVVLVGLTLSGWTTVRGARTRGHARAELAIAYGRPVVSAIEQFHVDRHRYPDRLASLVPQYLSGEALTAAERSPLGCPVTYAQVGGHYFVRLRAGGGGPSCEFSSATGKWYCSGML